MFVFGIMMVLEVNIKFLLDQCLYLCTLSVAFLLDFLPGFLIAKICLFSVCCCGVQ